MKKGEEIVSRGQQKILKKKERELANLAAKHHALFLPLTLERRRESRGEKVAADGQEDSH